MSQPTGRGRFGQLTYSSFDRGQGAGGGWQVKDTSGGLTEQEQEFLRTRVATQFDTAEPLPQFPTPEQVATLPRRLLYVPGAHGTAAYWHSVPAGLDGSGRPGNVFAHTVLDRDVTSAEPVLRPIELWRSPGWLVPYGSEQVLAATLPTGELPTSGTELNRASVLDFLLAPEHWRIGALCGLLDAVDAALRGGPPVVLLVGSADEGAQWIGAVSQLMSAGTARTVGWSTYERASGLTALWRKAIALAAVPRQDRAEIDPDTAVLLDPAAPLALGDLHGEPHRTEAGTPIPVTPWSVIAQVVLADRQLAECALTRQDAVAAQLGDHRLRPALPLALVVGESIDEFGDAATEAAQVITECAPDLLSARPELGAAAMALLRRAWPSSTAAAWEEVCALADRGRAAVQELASYLYVERALNDPYWQRRPEGIPFPANFSAMGAPPDKLVQAAREAVATVANAPDTMMANVHAVRIVDLVVRAGLVDRSDVARPSTVALIDELLSRAVLPALEEPGSAATLIEALGPLSEPMQAAFIRPLVARTPRMRQSPLGYRIPTMVLWWLFAAAPAPPSVRTLLSDPQRVDPLLGEFAVQVCLFGDPYRPVALAARHVALWALLQAAERGEEPLPDAAPLFVAGPWPADELHPLLAHFGRRVPGHLLLSTLLSAPYDNALAALLRVLTTPVPAGSNPVSRPAEHDYLAGEVIQLRQCAVTEWWQAAPQVVAPTAQRIVHWAAAFAWVPARSAAPDLVPTVLAGYLIDVVLRPFAESPHGLDEILEAAMQLPGACEWAREVVETCLDNRVVTEAQLAFMAISSAPDAPSDVLVTKRIRVLGAARVRDHESSGLAPILEAILRRRLAAGRLADPAELAETVLDIQFDSIPESVSDSEFNRLMSPFEKFAKQWWLAMGVAPGGMFGGRFRRR